MKTGIIIGRIGGLDGVALETEKWLYVLNELGHEITVLSGELEGNINFPVQVQPMLAFSLPRCQQEQQEVFLNPSQPEEKIHTSVIQYSGEIEISIREWLKQEQPDLLIIENACALPFHLSMGIAIFNILQKTAIPALAHNHDFFWERGKHYYTPYPSIQKLIQQSFPPVLPNLRHAVISNFAQQTLKEKFRINAHIIPNVMDFDKPFAGKDSYNSDIRECLGLKNDDIVLGQITRMVRRKGIETAIELVKQLENPKVKLVITGSDEDENNDGSYCAELKAVARAGKVENQILFAADYFALQRQQKNGKKIYSLEDAYFLADAVTYFSSYEGFGNAFVEAILAKKPVFVNNYKPVYWPDIGSKGFQTVQIENGILNMQDIADIKSILQNPRKSREMADINFELGKKFFSFNVLKKLLQEVLQGLKTTDYPA
jgi:glycosyltransferase involved in cell wall biosynthesis